ncbi:MAG: AMP-binding protein [Oscillospiraceae bacterium]|nr:AMP-binding protein [Oscillospiraceae bacterium]
MKLTFSTQYVRRGSFLDLCKMADEYGFAGFEIFDARVERHDHADSVLRAEIASDAKRKLYNRGLRVAALTCPDALESEQTTEKLLCQYVDFAADAGVEFVLVRVEHETPFALLAAKLSRALSSAAKKGVEILLESVGALCSTEKLVDLLHHFAAPALGAAWNTRGTFFGANETPDDTIRNLGAYIRYVRLGDNKDGRDCLLGEGTLPVSECLAALRSLDYDSYIACAWNDEITDPDIVLTHFESIVRKMQRPRHGRTDRFENRAHTGTFPWRKFEPIDLTFGQVLDVVADRYPDQLAFRYTTLDYTRTYAQFRRDVDRVAAALVSLGVKKGHHVAVWATNVPEWFLCFWAATKIGAVLVTVNTAYKIHEIEYLLRQSDTHTLVMIDRCKDIDYGAIIRELCPELEGHRAGEPLYAARLPFLRNIVTVGFAMEGCLTWRAFCDRADGVPQEEVRRRAGLVRPDDVANMQYTSGTTGFPKGVMLTHSNILNNGKTIGDRMDLSTADRMMIQVPMFHCFGMVLSMTSMMTHGGTLSPLPYFSAKSSLACIQQEKITCFNGVPTMFIAMFNHPDFAKTDFSSIRTGIMAGANCPPDLMRRAAAEMNMTEILSVYGQTEASPGCTMGEVNEDLDHRVETVGSAFPNIECKIVDPETGADLPDGVSGEFVVRGSNVMKGYYKMPHATAQAIDRDGWLHTGDLCCRSEDGYFRVTGRLKDMIIRGGENLYPREIEEFYLTHPAVRDVQVVGVPDEQYGEEACAWIILKDGEQADEDVMRAYGLSSMARHKVPRYFLFAQQFPMNAAGKILKYQMRDESIRLLNLKK